MRIPYYICGRYFHSRAVGPNLGTRVYVGPMAQLGHRIPMEKKNRNKVHSRPNYSSSASSDPKKTMARAARRRYKRPAIISKLPDYTKIKPLTPSPAHAFIADHFLQRTAYDWTNHHPEGISNIHHREYARHASFRSKCPWGLFLDSFGSG